MKTKSKITPKNAQKATKAQKAAVAPAKAAQPSKAPTPNRQLGGATGTKQAQFLALLRREKGVSIDEAAHALSWQRHSVRGVLSGVIKKRLGLDVQKIPSEGSATRYRLAH